MPIESNRPLAALVATIVMIASVKLVSAQQGFDEEPAAAPSANSPHDWQPDTWQPDTWQPCVLLRNDNVLFGSATQQGDYVIVQRGHGNEIRLPRGDVACWAGSIRNLYQYRADHRPKGNLAALIKDAHWCLRYDLLDLAEADIRAALQLDPGQPEAKRLQRQLDRRLSPNRSSVSYANTPPVVQPAGYSDDLPDLSGADLAALASFAGEIQPMLINRCGNCHSHTSPRLWKLTTPSAGGRVSARTARENLSAAMKFVDRQQPERSELWVKAVMPHGGAPAALDPRRQKAMTAFQQWLGMLGGPYTDTVPTPPPDHTGWAGEPLEAQPTVDDEAASETWTNRRPPTDRDAPARLPQVANPFDPDLFNRRYHPQ